MAKRYRVLEAAGSPPKRRRTVRRRKFRRFRAPRNNRIHNFTRVKELTEINSSTTADVLGAMTFKLSDLTNATEFTNLFDKFRICAVKLEIVPKFSGNDMNPGTTFPGAPCIHSVLDYNDATNPGDLNELMQYSNYKRTRGHNIHKRYFKPCVLAANYEGSVTTAYTSKWKVWLDCTDSGTAHFGLKYMIDRTPNVAFQYRAFVKYYIQCKDPK